MEKLKVERNSAILKSLNMSLKRYREIMESGDRDARESLKKFREVRRREINKSE